MLRIWLAVLFACAANGAERFPRPDSQGGWPKPASDAEARRVAGMDIAKLDEAFRYIQTTTKNGGLLVARHGWLVYEKYFGRAHREANANTGSCGKSFTSIAMGILLHERPDLFPDGLDQKVYNERYLPKEALPLRDPARAEIRLGQLLAMTAGIRGNNPGYVDGRRVTLDPPGPDGSPACLDDMAFGFKDGPNNTIALWTKPGGGYSYATSSIHLVSVIIRHVTGMEVDRYVEERLAKPMGWGRWGWGYRNAGLAHTCGGGGIAPRPADMLRFAYLLLHEGRWGERRLVPAEYVRLCGRRSPYNPHYPYSLQFNVNADGDAAGAPRDAFWKNGSGGHAFYVAPSLDLVIWKFGGRDAQFSPKDTGLEPLPESVFRYDGSREGWKRTAKEDDPGANMRTLEMVVAAVRDR